MQRIKHVMDMKEEIQRILDRNFTRGDNQKALSELCVLFSVSEMSDEDFGKGDIPLPKDYVEIKDVKIIKSDSH